MSQFTNLKMVEKNFCVIAWDNDPKQDYLVGWFQNIQDAENGIKNNNFYLNYRIYTKDEMI
jgi:hypothetical protein